MIDILLRNGDLVANRYGDIVLCEDESEDVVQTANNNILLRYGHNKFHTELGNKIYSRRKKSNQSGLEMVQQECINAMMKDSRIREIKQINVALLDNASCLVDYVLVYAKTVETQVRIDDTTNIDTLETYSEPGEILVEVDGRTYINAFNVEGGE